MLASLDFNGLTGGCRQGDNRIAVFDWTGLSGLNSPNCNACSPIQFGGQLFSNVEFYNDPSNVVGVGVLGAQKAGPIPLGDECGAAGLSVGTPPPASCPEGGIATNGDNITQASQAQNQLWGAVDTAINQTFTSETTPEVHAGRRLLGHRHAQLRQVRGLHPHQPGVCLGPSTRTWSSRPWPRKASHTRTAGTAGRSWTSRCRAKAAPPGPTTAASIPSTAYGRLTSTSGGLLGSIHVADLGQSPADGFTEYLGYPGSTRPRWGDYSGRSTLPWTGGKIDFATNYIQYPNCTGAAFTLTPGHLRRNQGWIRQLGHLSQLRRAVGT